MKALWLVLGTQVAQGLYVRCGARRRFLSAARALPVGVDPNDNLPAGWEVYEEDGATLYYNALTDETQSLHPYYDEDGVEEAAAAAAAIDALAALDAVEEAAVEEAAPAAPKAYVPPLGGRVVQALDDFVDDRPAETAEELFLRRVDSFSPEEFASPPMDDAVVDEVFGEEDSWSGASDWESPESAWGGDVSYGDDAGGGAAATAATVTDLEDGTSLVEEGDDGDASAEELLDLFEEDQEELYEELYEDERLGVAPSHELIEVDEDGDPVTLAQVMTYVDEATCVGCTMCASIAPQTFLMEDGHGRARVFNQEGDDEETLREAISTCPVSCIHFVPWDELVELERAREEAMRNYNFKGRLVGNDGFLGDNGVQEISSNNAARCNNCPTNECGNCPMFGVGDRASGRLCGNCPTNGCQGCPVGMKYPEFQKRRARRDRKRRILEKTRREAAEEALAGLQKTDRSVDL